MTIKNTNYPIFSVILVTCLLFSHITHASIFKSVKKQVQDKFALFRHPTKQTIIEITSFSLVIATGCVAYYFTPPRKIQEKRREVTTHAISDYELINLEEEFSSDEHREKVFKDKDLELVEIESEDLDINEELKRN